MSKLPFELTTRVRIEKQTAPTDPALGCAPEHRTIPMLIGSGIIVVNKPDGPTSRKVAERVRKCVRAKRTGHGGALDPMVTGALPVALGRATRAVQVLLKAGKEYDCTMQLHAKVSDDAVRAVAEKFVGRITQLPPVKSSVVRRLRERSVYYLDDLAIEGRKVRFRVGCEAGTYIRKLVHDMGVELGCGAHMIGLVRTKAGPYTLEHAVTLDDLYVAFQTWKQHDDDRLLRRWLLPIESIVAHLPKIWMHDSVVPPVIGGARLYVPGVMALDSGIQPEDTVALMTQKNELVGIGLAKMSSDDTLRFEKGIAAASSRILMDPDVYPRRK